MRRLVVSSVLVVSSMLLVAAAVARADDAPVVSWEQAGDHVGQRVVVEGRVLGVHCSPTSCLLAFEPTFNRFTAVVEAASFDRLPPDELDQRYVGRQVRVRGTVRLIDRKPEIVVDGPDDLQLVVTKEERAAEQTRQAQTQVELVERLGAVLDRLEDLTERMAATQERLDAAMAALEQRQAALAAAMPTPPLAPPAPTYGGPAPRAGYEALRTLKRGMSMNDVQRLVGQPLEIVPQADGGAVWDYGFGRTISFDRRGRAVALVGFPQP
jgi:hypothetical protein